MLTGMINEKREVTLREYLEDLEEVNLPESVILVNGGNVGHFI